MIFDAMQERAEQEADYYGRLDYAKEAFGDTGTDYFGELADTLEAEEII